MLKFLVAIALCAMLLLPTPTYAVAGCENGHSYDASGSRSAESCHIVSGGTIMGVVCPLEIHQTDGGGKGAATADQAARMTQARQCAEWYNATVLGVLGNGNIDAGGDGLSNNLPVRASAWKP